MCVVGASTKIVQLGRGDALHVVDDQHTRGLEGIEQRAVGCVRAVRQRRGGQAEGSEQRGPQLRQRRFHRHHCVSYGKAAWEQAQGLVEGEGLAMPGVPVHTQETAGSCGVCERLGHLSYLPRRHDMRARRV